MQPTNPNQFTEKAWQAISHTPDLAKQAQQQQVESEHLMQSLLEQEGLASAIFNKAEINIQQVRDRTTEFINRQPKVNNASSVYLGRSLDNLLDRAEKYRKEFGDEYISVEHLILGFIKDDRFGKALFSDLGLNEKQLKTLIKEIRGNQKVTDQNPEVKYQSLEK